MNHDPPGALAALKGRRLRAMLACALLVGCSPPIGPAPRDDVPVAERADSNLDAPDADAAPDVPVTDAAPDAALDAPDAPSPDAPVDVPLEAAPTCPPGEARCGAACQDLRNATAHCGACGVACAFAHAAARCVTGECRMGDCAEGWGDCNDNPLDGCETDLSTSPAHCGRCGSSCAAGGVCSRGACGSACEAPGQRCGGACADTSRDTRHCGLCNNACPPRPNATATCAGGRCDLLCQPGWEDCNGQPADGCEASVRGDPAHCGRCGAACRPGELCSAGVCAPVCEAPTTRCGGRCEDLATSASSCGRCGNACPAAPRAQGVCRDGACALACEPGYADCNGDARDGCEVATGASAAHCGRCGNACPAGRACSLGVCVLGDCLAPTARCGEQCVDVTTDPANCGACGRACAAGASCVAGRCEVRCDGARPTRCGAQCVDASSDPMNCGACGNACPAGQRCEGARCVLPCAAGEAACGAVCVATAGDVRHCGACGNACPTGANASPTCAAGRCGLACAAGFADCDRAAANGCEVNLQASAAHCGACGRVCAAGQACMGGSCVAVCGLTTCGAQCVDTATDASHCGACGRACALPNATAACRAGGCAVGSCAPGFADCDRDATNGCEANLQSSAPNCGACGVDCGRVAGQSCQAGVCRCAAGQVVCAGRCVNPQSDASHCGACGTSCGAGQSCVSGACVTTSCPSGQTLCSGRCVNANADIAHCGGCGNACPSQANAAPSCAGGACGLACASGWADCDRSLANGCEANTLSSDANCGACGRACAAGQSCVSGVCTLICPSGQTNCSGVCRNLTNDNANCGACGNGCPVPANVSSATCVGGACGFFCNTGFSSCDGNSANGCEVNYLTDPGHCGHCLTACPAAPNATPTCGGGRCGLACASGWADCDRSSVNGCEANTLSSDANCGACGRACGAGTQCRSGSCMPIVCPAGTFLCNGACAPALNSDPSNCGACGRVCGTANTSASACRAGACSLTCAAGFADCDLANANGCETAIGNGAINNCGACGNRCPVPAGAALATCVGGACGMLCNTGFRSCDGSNANGCEVNTQTDRNHCGDCGNVCPAAPNATPTCSGGNCGLACNDSRGNCDGNAANGCEANLATDRNNCGACGSVCPTYAHATSGCDFGWSCTMVCDAGYANCDGTRSNGCETYVGSGAVDNCGACGNRCPVPAGAALATCVGGACGMLCNTGFRSCDGSNANGCEVNLLTDRNHCGGCGNACPAAANATPTCDGGGCAFACNAGYCDADRNAANGCEAAIHTQHACRACGDDCGAGRCVRVGTTFPTWTCMP